MDILISVLAGAVGVPLVNLLKKEFHLVDEAAMLLTFAVSILLGIAALFISGQLTGENFTAENMASTAGIVLSIATLVYKLIYKPAPSATS